MCFSKRKRTTPTNEAKAYAIRKTYLNQHVLLKRKRTDPCSMLRIGREPQNLTIAFGNLKYENFIYFFNLSYN